MRHRRSLLSGSVRSARRRAVGSLLLLLAAAACSRSKKLDDMEPRPEPVTIHVINENFLDVTVAVVAGGVSRRLGMVTGNNTSEYSIPWSVANGSGVTLTAAPIGSNARYASPTINVGPGQVIEFKIGSVLRQSVISVHEP